MHRLDLLTRHLKADFLVRMDIAFLDQRTTWYNDEELPFWIMPVKPLGNTGLRNIHAHLTVISSFDQLGEWTAVVVVHLQLELELIRRQITQVKAVELFGKAAVGDRRDKQCLRLRLEQLQQIDNLAEGDGVGQRHIAIATVCLFNRL